MKCEMCKGTGESENFSDTCNQCNVYRKKLESLLKEIATHFKQSEIHKTNEDLLTGEIIQNYPNIFASENLVEDDDEPEIFVPPVFHMDEDGNELDPDGANNLTILPSVSMDGFTDFNETPVEENSTIEDIVDDFTDPLGLVETVQEDTKCNVDIANSEEQSNLSIVSCESIGSSKSAHSETAPSTSSDTGSTNKSTAKSKDNDELQSPDSLESFKKPKRGPGRPPRPKTRQTLEGILGVETDILKKDNAPLEPGIIRPKWSFDKVVRFPCPFCDKSFPYKFQLDAHNVKHTGIKPHQCSQCEKKFSSKSTLYQHNLLVHCKDPEGEFECKECDKRYTVKRALEFHQLIVHYYPSRNKPKPAGTVKKKRGRPFGSGTNRPLAEGVKRQNEKQKCDVCEKMVRYYYMKTHMKMHTGQRDELCKICGKGFTSKILLRQHDLIVHGRSDSGKYQCEICLSRWKTMESLKRHLNTIHRLTGLRQDTDESFEETGPNEIESEDLTTGLWNNIAPEITMQESELVSVKAEPI